MTENNAELGHVQLEVDDLERSVAFYRRYLGLRVSERMESRKGRVVLLSGGDRHREVALRDASQPDLGGGGSEEPGRVDGDDSAEGATGADDGPGSAEDAGRRGGAGLATGGALSAPFQVGFELADRQALTELFFELRTAEIPTTAVDHGVSWSLYFRDPDGNALEAYWDTRAQEEGRDLWGGRSRLLSVEQILPDERVRELADRLRERAEREAEAQEEAADESGEEAGGEAAADAEGPDAGTASADPAEERPATSD